MKQPWVCESCGLSGTVELSDHCDVWTGVNALEAHHDKLAAKYAPSCRFKAAKVRVHNPAEMTEFEWNRFVAEIEKRAKVERA